MSAYFDTLPPVSAAYDKIQKYANFIHHFRFVSVFFGVSVSQNGLSEMLRQLTASLIISPSQKRHRLYDLGLALSCFNGAGFVFLHRMYFITNDSQYSPVYSPKEAAYPFTMTASSTVESPVVSPDVFENRVSTNEFPLFDLFPPVVRRFC